MHVADSVLFFPLQNFASEETDMRNQYSGCDIKIIGTGIERQQPCLPQQEHHKQPSTSFNKDNTMAIIYALVSRQQTVLAEQTSATGEWKCSSGVIPKLSAVETLRSSTTIGPLAENDRVLSVLQSPQEKSIRRRMETTISFDLHWLSGRYYPLVNTTLLLYLLLRLIPNSYFAFDSCVPNIIR